MSNTRFGQESSINLHVGESDGQYQPKRSKNSQLQASATFANKSRNKSTNSEARRSSFGRRNFSRWHWTNIGRLPRGSQLIIVPNRRARFLTVPIAIFLFNSWLATSLVTKCSRSLSYAYPHFKAQIIFKLLAIFISSPRKLRKFLKPRIQMRARFMCWFCSSFLIESSFAFLAPPSIILDKNTSLAAHGRHHPSVWACANEFCCEKFREISIDTNYWSISFCVTDE